MYLKITEIDTPHLSEMLRIENESFSSPWTEKSFTDALSNPIVKFYGAFSDKNNLCGFSCVAKIDMEAEILNIAVSKNCRKCGIGTKLLNETLSALVSSGVSTVFLEVRESNTSARSLYDKAGFEIIGKRRQYYSNPTEDAILMQKTI